MKSLEYLLVDLIPASINFKSNTCLVIRYSFDKSIKASDICKGFYVP